MPEVEDIFPPAERLLTMEPEEVGSVVLEYLCAKEDEDKAKGHTVGMGHENFLRPGTEGWKRYCGQRIDEVAPILSEGWAWLEKEVLIAPKPGNIEVFLVTRRGREARDGAEFQRHLRASFLRKETLDAGLQEKAWPDFVQGRCADAVFAAFKEVEVRVRKAGGFQQGLVGVPLMRKAFHEDSGCLSDPALEHGEREAMSHLFAGSIGFFKNPGSHRDVELNEPAEAAEAILLANHLLRIVGHREAALQEGKAK